MKISNKEKIMLVILGILLIGFGYYDFIYLSQESKIEEKIKQEAEVKQKYTAAIETINSLEDRKGDVKVLKAKIGDQSSPFYPVISEEHIIVELDKLLKDSGLKGGITFKPIVSDSVENSSKEQSSLPKSSFQGIVDNYTNIISTDEKSKSNITSTSNSDGENNTNNNNSNANNSKPADAKEKKNTVQYLKGEIKFEGNYQALDKFLDEINKNKKKIVINTVKISQSTLDGLNGTIQFEIYSVPKITDELEEYLKWDSNKTYGKSVPFSKGAASGVTNLDKNFEDFIVSVKSINSDLPTVILGSATDSLRTTYVYADSNKEENVEMILTQNGNKYYYKYKTSKGSFPANYNGLGAEFLPESKNIVINILSEARVTENDNSSIKLKIINNTDKLTEVNISGDDISNPRVKIDGDRNNITVNQK